MIFRYSPLRDTFEVYVSSQYFAVSIISREANLGQVNADVNYAWVPNLENPSTGVFYTRTGNTWTAQNVTIQISLNWEDLLGKPSSTPVAIDSAVSQAHAHPNAAVISKLSVVGGKLYYDGVIVAPAGHTHSNLELLGLLGVDSNGYLTYNGSKVDTAPGDTVSYNGTFTADDLVAGLLTVNTSGRPIVGVKDPNGAYYMVAPETLTDTACVVDLSTLTISGTWTYIMN